MTKTDIARRVFNHTWKLDPIIRSLIDTDFYKLLMLQMIWKLYPDVSATFSLINRTKTVRLADESVCIGPPPSRDSYLNIHQIVAACEITGADAVHPGYGFLSENAKFADILDAHGITFIGPTADHIRIMGDKIEAKRTAKRLGIPCVPGSEGGVSDEAEALKIIREIGVAARGGGGDPNNNPRLRVAMDKGLAANMSKDVIERAIKKATGELEGVEYEEIRYEGYAPGGVAVIVDCLTDNRVRTVADVRHAFSKCGGNMGTEGSVAFMFKRLGVLAYAPGADEEKITEAAIEAGADDIVVYPDDGSLDVVTAPENFQSVKDAMEGAGLAPGHAEITFRADNDIAVAGDTALQVKKLLDMLEDLDDVQDVYSNVDQAGLEQA